MGVFFSGDGRWLTATPAPCRVGKVGRWDEPGRVMGGVGLCFSPDGRMVVVQDARRVLQLVEVETGRTIASFERLDLSDVGWATFTPDGSRLVLSTPGDQAVHVWDRKATGERLRAMGLDWEAFADATAAAIAAVPALLSRIRVDFGDLAGHLPELNEPAEEVVARSNSRLSERPQEADAFHDHGHAQARLGRRDLAVADLTSALRRRPRDAALLACRAGIFELFHDGASAIADHEASLALDPNQSAVRESLALCWNNRAWDLANGPESSRDPILAIELAGRATRAYPGRGIYWNTLGVAHDRAGRFDETVAALEHSRELNRNEFVAFDLFFLAMTHHRLGHPAQARACHDQALAWIEQEKSLTPGRLEELRRFRVEWETLRKSP